MCFSLSSENIYLIHKKGKRVESLGTDALITFQNPNKICLQRDTGCTQMISLETE
jgi:hypothetical protein